MSAATDSIECPRGMRWCKHVLPKQHLLSAVPHLYKCLDAPVFATEYIGSPLILERIHATFRPRPTGTALPLAVCAKAALPPFLACIHI